LQKPEVFQSWLAISRELSWVKTFKYKVIVFVVVENESTKYKIEKCQELLDGCENRGVFKKDFK
jgi:hypothetical protein